MYRMDCNTCTCKDNTLLCSKMACINLGDFKDLTRQKRKREEKKRDKECNDMNVFNYVQSYCTKTAFKRSKDSKQKQLIASDREFLTLPELPHHAAECVPSKKYKVDCNVCICTKHKNLICDKKMCVDRKTTRHIEAKKHSGKSCTKSFETKKCVKCHCKKGQSECVPIHDCHSEADKLMLSKGAGNINRLTFDYKEDECLPDVVYKEKCNKCYCQPDKTLRCTNKMCLNHEQALQLEEQREYLEEHGL